MKYLFTLLLCAAATLSMSAQTPEKMSYQAIIRGSNNNLVVNSNVSIKILIRQGSVSGTAVYQESHTATTNANGLVSLVIGSGSVISGTFSQIAWASNTYFIETQVDVSGGSNYSVVGSSQLLSVPYALHAKTAESITGATNRAVVISFASSRNINSADINNTLACTTSATLTLSANFLSMAIGDTINLEAHNGAILTIKAATGVTLNYTAAGSGQYVSTAGNVRFGLLRKTGANAYIISGQ